MLEKVDSAQRLWYEMACKSNHIVTLLSLWKITIHSFRFELHDAIYQMRDCVCVCAEELQRSAPWYICQLLLCPASKLGSSSSILLCSTLCLMHSFGYCLILHSTLTLTHSHTHTHSHALSLCIACPFVVVAALPLSSRRQCANLNDEMPKEATWT